MAILCLATSLRRPEGAAGRIVVARPRDRKPVRARDLKVHGAMAVLLKDALKPNLVQTLENNPALVHGGPFANIAHGCNSVIATRTALKLADYVVTEAGFGADLGAEKFIDIKCRKSGLRPSAAVLVATVRALKYHGGVDPLPRWAGDLAGAGARPGQPAAPCRQRARGLRPALRGGGQPLRQRHTGRTGWRCRTGERSQGVSVIEARHWSQGGAGATELARAVVQLCETPGQPRFVYDSGDTLWDKLHKVATRVYRATGIQAPEAVRKRLDRLQRDGHGGLSVCIAKTPYSFWHRPRRSAVRRAAT
jgi:formate--tetrahydrofolate ligase